ncbi:unnamed protein product [Caenorhabditis bovis]|uniref:Tyrosine specific protein phosphatases domain-containing protein n=1 Tax=Caenorhabditis bovis TaxID=2654633 RepID=A0A8S1FDK6_9PELO|nr:unnamed protein product [Caenorhabditis bovis]
MNHSYNNHRRSRHSHQHRPRQNLRRFPDRWDRYDNVGRDIEGTRFVPFKTPLDDSFFYGKDLPQELQFGVRSLINMARQANKEIGLVIDLTNTDRYYDKTEWADHGVKYIKLNCPGHEVDEREDLVEKFIDVVKEFVENPENGTKLIGVHCTHGLNRTGYLICRYLIDVENYTAADAISVFEFYRGHPMERPKYKKSLYDAELYKKGLLPRQESESTEEGAGDSSAHQTCTP